MSAASIIDDTDTKAGRAFDATVLALILISIATLSIETLPNLSPATRFALKLSETIITLLFTLEYFARIATVRSKKAYIFSFYGLIDLFAILPFYLALGIDLRGLRAFRLFRILHLLKMTRYTRAVSRFRRALAIAKEEIVLFSIATGILLYISSIGIYYFESKAQPEQFASVFHSLWWAVATLSTVGYGDIYPITLGGRIFTFVVLMIGLGIVSVPAGLVASALSEARKAELQDNPPADEGINS